LLEDFEILKSFVQVGKKYGVSDNAVRKWLKVYQIDEDMVKRKSSARTEMASKDEV
jgi:transposase-like protein